MSRKVFFSFHYDNDINRSMVVRNSWVTKGGEASDFIDKADFEKIKLKGEKEIHKWIDNQLKGTSVTVVLIGSETLERKFVRYEICKSLEKNNAIIGVYIHNIKDMKTKECSKKGNPHTIIEYREDKTHVYFDEICKKIYDYEKEDGYNNLGKWVEEAAKLCNR